jgi:hypothetical protein
MDRLVVMPTSARRTEMLTDADLSDLAQLASRELERRKARWPCKERECVDATIASWKAWLEARPRFTLRREVPYPRPYERQRLDLAILERLDDGRQVVAAAIEAKRADDGTVPPDAVRMLRSFTAPTRRLHLLFGGWGTVPLVPGEVLPPLEDWAKDAELSFRPAWGGWFQVENPDQGKYLRYFYTAIQEVSSNDGSRQT